MSVAAVGGELAPTYRKSMGRKPTMFEILEILFKTMHSRGGGDVSEWRAVYPKHVPQQQDAVNWGIFVIATALAVAMGEEDCGQIVPAQWRIWLAGGDRQGLRG